MWLGKTSLKVAALVLVGTVSSMAATAISPLTFGSESSDVNNWNYLTQYKLWGTDGIELGNRPGFYDPKYFDKSTMSYPADIDLLTLGAVGTVKNLSSVGDGGWLDGPIVVGGSITNSGQNFEILTGPVRVGGSNGAIVRNGVQTCSMTASTGQCDPSIIPDYRSNIKVPTLSGVTWGGSLSVGNNSNKRTLLDVSSACSGGTCDLYYSSIDFQNDSRLVISIPEKQIARIFTKSLNLKTHPEIVVRDPVAGKDLAPSEYKGNLVIYVDGDITFENIDNVQIMGTLVSNGTLTMKCNMIISGQFIANKIVIGNEIDAKNFTFKRIWPTAKLIVDNNSKRIKESDKWEPLDIVLDKESEEKVTFDYCFEFDKNGEGVQNTYAGYADVGTADASHKFPICNKGEVGKGEIPVGQLKATGINIKPLIDGYVEKDEALWFQINNIKGAELSSDYEANLGYKIFIVSNDELPTVSSELVVNAKEDTDYKFTASEFKFLHTSNFASVIISGLPNKGTLSYNGSVITSVGSSGYKVAVANLGKLVYRAEENHYGNGYAKFKYKVVGDGAGDVTSKEYTATVNVAAVNDKPTVADATFFVSELDHLVSGGPIVVNDISTADVSSSDLANERSKDTYTYKLDETSGDYAEFKKVFDISKLSNQNATITVKSGAVLNYNKKSKYVVYATVTDDAATESAPKHPETSDKFKITINIKNDNDAPTVGNEKFTKPEKNPDGKDWPSGEPVGEVTSADDPDGDPLTYSVITSGVPFKFDNGTAKLVITDGSKLDFETKPTWTFKFSVTDGEKSAEATITVDLTDVNEPPPQFVLEKEYKVNENSPKGTRLPPTFVVEDYDKVSGSLEVLKYELSGAITGAAAATTTLKNKTLADIFEVVEVKANGGKRDVAIQVKNQSLLDYEALYKASTGNATYPVKITVTDKANHSVSASTKITVLDVNETLTAQGGSFSLQEHLPIGSPVCKTYAETVDKKPGDCLEVARVTASDLDIYNPSFSNLTYVMSTTNTADASKFTVNRYNGELYSNHEFDYETEKSTYTFKVTVSDGDFSKEVEVTVKILDIVEPTIEYDTEGSALVKEGSEGIVEDFSKVLEKIEDDEIQQKLKEIKSDLTYEVDQDASASAKNLFDIQDQLGIITVKSALDFESLYPNNTYTVVVVASGYNSTNNLIRITINRKIVVTDVNEPPTITNSTAISVPETKTNADGAIGYIEATDPDFCSKVSASACPNGNHPYLFNKLTYKVDEVLEVNGSLDFPFNVDPFTGKITVAPGKELNYTKQNKYMFVARVTDSSRDPENPPQSTTKTITILVTDVNRPSKFEVLTSPYEVEERADIGTVLDGGNIVVYDEDAADKDKLKITITDKDATAALDAAELFEVVQVGKTDANLKSKFVIKTIADLDYEKLYKATEGDAVFNVTLTVEDTKGNKTTQDTKIRVIDVNEEPAFKNPPYNFKVSENTTKSTSLGIAKAEDPDIYNPSFGTLYFSLKGEESALFDIDGRTGEIFTINNAKFDYETKKLYTFKVVVTDKEFEKEAVVTVNVENVDEGPVFSDIPVLTVDENTLKGTKVGEVLAIDDDCKGSFSTTCKSPKYSITASEIAPDDYKAFTYVDGVIKVAKDSILNYEVQDEYIVHLVVTDAADPTLSDGIDVKIKVNDVNDAPTYKKKEYPFEVHENAKAGEFVGSVVADDEDSWSVLKYSLSDYETGSKDANAFKIEDGKIYLVSNALNFEKKEYYYVWVTATDNGEARGFKNYSATTLAIIHLLDDADKPIIEDDGEEGYDVEENTIDNNAPTGFEIACYDVHDEDVRDGKPQVESLVPYVTDAGNTDADRLFDAKIKKVDSKYQLCLIVKNGDRLNYETITHTHKVNVSVMDADGETDEVTKTIKIVDVNEMPVISGGSEFVLYENKGANSAFAKLYPDDIDTSKVFTDNVFAAVGGDTDLFTITADGKLKTLRDFDYETAKRKVFELDVTLSDRDSKKYPKLKTSKTIVITLKDAPEIPVITKKDYDVDEGAEEGVLIGQLEATDPDGEGVLIFELAEKSPYVTVSPEGEIKVAKGADIDYEKMQKFTIKVKVKDIDGMSSESEIVIKVNDLNEPPTLNPQEFTFPEDSKPGTKKGPIEAKDPDTKNKEFSTLKFYPIDENDKFEIKTSGDIVLKGDLDYEKEKSYVIKVYVTDGEFSDTTDITIKVGNVVEKSEVEITRVEAGDSVYIKPKNKTIYTNQEVITVEWKQDGKPMSSLDTLKEGCQIITKSYKDKSKDVAGSDSIEVCFSKSAPVVDIDTKRIKVEADNIYTIVEGVDKKDSSVYVNDKTKEVTVSVKDSASGVKESFKVVVVLDTLAISDKTVKDMVSVSKSEITLEKNPKTDVYEKPIGDKKKISYTKIVNGDSVTVSYFVDDKGEMVKSTVIDEDGKKTSVEVIEVSKTVVVKGKKVIVSYKADAKTGQILYGDSEGNLLVDAPKSSSGKDSDSGDVDLKTGVGAFTVTYIAKGEDGDKTTVSYVIDEKGKIVANEEGDRGYLVTYTYTNKFGNSADKSVFMVLDKLAPIVEILSPSDGDVVYANFVDVDWCIAVDGDKKNCVKQDTLNFQSLEKGVNTIKRIYRDKAGNETIAEVKVMMKKAKDVNIDLEEPMVIVSIDSVNKYYDQNPPEEDQTYAVTVYNPKTDKEVEVIKGTSKKSKKGSGDEPYPGYKGHIGPTVTIDMKLPIVSAVGGLATLDDIIINGNMVALEGVDADGSEKVSVDEYVKKYCSEEFQKELGKDYSAATLYTSKARVTLWFFTTSGQFVDEYKFDYDIDDPDFVDKAGLVKFFFEMKPDMNGELRDANGRLYGTGPYIVKTKVEVRSKQRCVVPPVDSKSKIGDILKSSDEMMKRFGYRRPVLRGNEKASKSSKKENKKSSSKKK